MTPLTVKELIEKLSALPNQNAFVFIIGEDKAEPVVSVCPDEDGNDIIICDEETSLAFC